MPRENEDIVVNETNMLLLSDAAWSESKHITIIDKARKFLASGAKVSAICWTTAAPASFRLLNQRSHTSNVLGFLEMFSLDYKN